MPRLFITGVVLFLLLGAGYGFVQAARAVPWDCSDWEAFAHEDRATAILESLAENRGKTLYCGIDQSDTFGKAETWEAGKDRNERDDTVYFGERGQFRGFIAAQEGWLTEGKSGITGQSEASIFEFPREERQGRRVKKFSVGSGPVTSQTDNTCMTDLQDGRTAGTLICSNWGQRSGNYNQNDHNTPKKDARYYLGQIGGSTFTDWDVEWDTQRIFRRELDTQTNMQRVYFTGRYAYPSREQWLDMARAAARSACRAEGYPRVGYVTFGPGHSDDPGGSSRADANYTGEGLGWFYDREGSGFNNYRARQSRTWRAVCEKKGARR